jgi:hypothetical protein
LNQILDSRGRHFILAKARPFAELAAALTTKTPRTPAGYPVCALRAPTFTALFPSHAPSCATASESILRQHYFKGLFRFACDISYDHAIRMWVVAILTSKLEIPLPAERCDTVIREIRAQQDHPLLHPYRHINTISHMYAQVYQKSPR